MWKEELKHRALVMSRIHRGVVEEATNHHQTTLGVTYLPEEGENLLMKEDLQVEEEDPQAEEDPQEEEQALQEEDLLQVGETVLLDPLGLQDHQDLLVLQQLQGGINNSHCLSPESVLSCIWMTYLHGTGTTIPP
ncbi:hypothetical protein JAAARDRAFT_45209 [Jaapia argillacea MUCL 33604]|uniref:Uncharacterized protein n=1 Tax=Jaapia argillacea MUCL 33604 TaxID=933084 RepID=A0A067QDR1_9AGAM|nr:hypothetical protein JAAARDRAFT_45209 [Jaapia argillacea MUCL 33604]